MRSGRPQDKDIGDHRLRSADSRGLGGEIGVDPTGLVAEVKRFNKDVARGRPNLGPLDGGRFYAYRQGMTTLGTNGGAVIDESARVIDLDGRPIPGLFAAGNCAASLFGRAYPGGGALLGLAAPFGLWRVSLRD